MREKTAQKGQTREHANGGSGGQCPSREARRVREESWVERKRGEEIEEGWKWAARPRRERLEGRSATRCNEFAGRGSQGVSGAADLQREVLGAAPREEIRGAWRATHPY